MRWLCLAAILLLGLGGCGKDESGAPQCDVSPAAIEFRLAFFTGPPDSHSVTRDLRVRNEGGQDLEFTAELHAPTGAGCRDFARRGLPARYVMHPGRVNSVGLGASN